MARSLRDMKKGGTKAAAQKETPPVQPSEAQRESVAALVNEYGGRNETELMGELFRVTAEQKRDGSFDAEGMRRTAESIMPMLTPEQRDKLMRIIGALGG